MTDRPMPGAAALDVTDVIVADHREVESLFDRLMTDGQTTARLSLDERQTTAERIVLLLSQHAVAEEALVYPLLRRESDEGDEQSDHALDEHKGIKRALADLDQATAGTEAFDDALRRTQDEVSHHVDEEERQVLPSLRRSVGEERLRELVGPFEEMKAKAPTRPHPHAPDKPPFNKVASAVSAPVDRIRDEIRDDLR